MVLALSNLLAGNHETAVEVLIAAAGSAGALDKLVGRERVRWEGLCRGLGAREVVDRRGERGG